MIEIIFAVTSIVAIIAAILTVSSHNAVHALLYLVTMMLAIALIFFLLGSPFAAALQVIVYAGAVMVLFIFVTMMLHQGSKSLKNERKIFNRHVAKGPMILSAILIAELMLFSFDTHRVFQASTVNALSVKLLAIELFSTYQLLVILAAILLLAALISAIHITKQVTSAAIKPHHSTTERPNSDPIVQDNADKQTPISQLASRLDKPSIERGLE